jgi:hypothetical protein
VHQAARDTLVSTRTPSTAAGGADGVHRPMIRLPVRDESTDADDRMVNVLRKFVADRLANFHFGLADKIIGGGEPAEVRHGLQIPDMTLGFMQVEG